MNLDILNKLEKLYNIILKSIQDQLSYLNGLISSLQTSVTTIQNTNLPSKVDKVGALNPDLSYINSLTGDFEYGTISGPTTVAYRGVINFGSRLRHYGDTVDPADVVNVQFVNNKIDPVRNLALLAIKRIGDNVSGTNTNQLTYNFTYCTFNFDTNSPVTFNGNVTLNKNVNFSATSVGTYSGLIDDSNNVSMVNVGYVKQKVSDATQKLFASWTNHDPVSHGITKGESPDNFSLNFTDYFTPETGGQYYLVNKAITFSIVAKISANADYSGSGAQDGLIQLQLKQSIGGGGFTVLDSSLSGTSSNNSAGGDQQNPKMTVVVVGILTLNPGDKFALSYNDLYGTANSSRISTAIITGIVL